MNSSSGGLEDASFLQMRYDLQQEELDRLRARNQQLEESLIRIIEETDADKAHLIKENELLVRKLELLLGNNNSEKKTSMPYNGEEPDDPIIDQLCLPSNSMSASYLPSYSIRGYHHIPMLSKQQGFIYGFKWEIGSNIKVV